ncbi:MAG: hypothetical protein ACK2UM_00445 [Anaerolineales bacterium]
MSRIINVDGVGKQRKKLTREIVLSLRKLSQQSDVNNETRDLAAFIALNLEAVHRTIEITVTPWEKRDYWVKADRFRMEWAWSESYAEEMRIAVLEDDWGKVAILSAKIAEKLKSVQVPVRNRLGEPWHGAWKILSNSV